MQESPKSFVVLGILGPGLLCRAAPCTPRRRCEECSNEAIQDCPGSVPEPRITQGHPPSSRGLTTGSTTEYMVPVVKPRDDGVILVSRQEKDRHIPRQKILYPC
ncbi:MAG: palindromic element RPE4 domain-containing protein [Alphaproteobacteria bacterium]|nr:palindromic element RPE4 domain-containing protein [Alphaproteobacteria bacterium]